MNLKKMTLNSHVKSLSIVITAIVLVFSQSFKNNFVWDDFDFIVNWTALNDFPSNTQQLLLGELPSKHAHAYRPLRSIYYGISYQLWEQNPYRYHIQALFIHLLAVISCYFLTYQFSKNRAASSFAALVFGLHPSNTEAFLWITASFDTIGNVFFIASFASYIWYKNQSNKKILYLSFFFAGIAYYTYELTLMLPAIVVAYDYIVEKKLHWKTYRWFVGLQIFYWYMRFVVLSLSSNKPPMFDSLSSNLAMSVVLIAKYCQQLFIPLTISINHQLTQNYNAFFYHDTDLFLTRPTLEITNSSVMISLVILIGVGVIALKVRHKIPLISFGIISIFLGVLPVLQFFPRSIVFSERYLYPMSAIVIAGVITGLTSNLPHRYLNVFKVLVCFVIGIFVFKSFIRVGDWYTNISLWESTIKTTPQSATMFRNSSDWYYKTNNYAKAEELALEAMRLKKNDPAIIKNYVAALEAQERLDESEYQLLKLTQIVPNDFYGYAKLGEIYKSQQKYQLAKKYFLQALQLESPYKDVFKSHLIILEQQIAETERLPQAE